MGIGDGRKGWRRGSLLCSLEEESPDYIVSQKLGRRKEPC